MYILKTDFQYTTNTGSIFTLKPGVQFERLDNSNYQFKHERKTYKINKTVLENNPTFFELVNFETLLIDLLKKINSKPYKKKAEDIVELIEDNILADKELVDKDLLKESIKACVMMYQKDNDQNWLKIVDDMGYTIDDDGEIVKK